MLPIRRRYASSGKVLGYQGKRSDAPFLVMNLAG